MVDQLERADLVLAQVEFPLEKFWSDKARAAALEARRRGAAHREQEKHFAASAVRQPTKNVIQVGHKQKLEENARKHGVAAVFYEHAIKHLENKDVEAAKKAFKRGEETGGDLGRRAKTLKEMQMAFARGKKLKMSDHYKPVALLGKKLGSAATASDYIHDFVNSSNPKFEGKSKKDRIRMALGAYYGRAKSAPVLDRAKAALAKAGFDPSQPRDDEGHWTATGAMEARYGHGIGGNLHAVNISAASYGSGGGRRERVNTSYHEFPDEQLDREHKAGSYPPNTPISDKAWKHLTQQEKGERSADVLDYINAKLLNPRERITALDREFYIGAKKDMSEAAQRNDWAGVHAVTQQVHDKLLAERQANRAQQRQSLYTDDVTAQLIEQAEGRTGQENFTPNYQETAKLPTGWRKTIAEVTGKIKDVAAGVTSMLQLVNELAGSSAPASVSQLAGIAGAAATLSGGINILSRSKDIPTARESIILAHKAARELQAKIDLASGPVGVKRDIRSAINQAEAKLNQAEASILRSEYGKTYQRVYGTVTGGKTSSYTTRTGLNVPKNVFSPRHPKAFSTSAVPYDASTTRTITASQLDLQRPNPYYVGKPLAYTMVNGRRVYKRADSVLKAAKAAHN